MALLLRLGRSRWDGKNKGGGNRLGGIGIGEALDGWEGEGILQGYRLGHEISRGPEAGGQQSGWLPLLQCLSLNMQQQVGPLELQSPISLQVEPPELPEDLKHWITYNETSSQLLRAESGLRDRKDQ